MTDCPNCEYHRKRAQLWRDEAYKQAGHPLPERDEPPPQRKPLTPDNIRKTGGIVHGDGNIFFTNINQLNTAIRAREQE